MRGTTSKKIIKMARDAGAKAVFFASAAPPIKFQNLYGIDMAATDELVASNKTEEEVCKEIGADWLVYQELDDLISTVQEGNPNIASFEISIFNGEYPTAVDDNYLKSLENSRKDEVKRKREQQAS